MGQKSKREMTAEKRQTEGKRRLEELEIQIKRESEQGGFWNSVKQKLYENRFTGWIMRQIEGFISCFKSDSGTKATMETGLSLEGSSFLPVVSQMTTYGSSVPVTAHSKSNSDPPTKTGGAIPSFFPSTPAARSEKVWKFDLQTGKPTALEASVKSM